MLSGKGWSIGGVCEGFWARVATAEQNQDLGSGERAEKPAQGYLGTLSSDPLQSSVLPGTSATDNHFSGRKFICTCVCAWKSILTCYQKLTRPLPLCIPSVFCIRGCSRFHICAALFRSIEHIAQSARSLGVGW